MQRINDACCYKSVRSNKSDNDDDEMLVRRKYFAYKALTYYIGSSYFRVARCTIMYVLVGISIECKNQELEFIFDLCNNCDLTIKNPFLEKF